MGGRPQGRRGGAALAVAFVALLASPVAAQPRSAPGAASTFRVDLARELTAALIGIVLVDGGGALATSAFGPTSCRWCATNGFDEAARRRLRWDDAAAAATASDVLIIGAVPVVAAGLTTAVAAHDGAAGDWAENLVVIAEAMVAAAAVTHAAKLTAARARPYVRELAPAAAAEDPEAFISFFSGHSSRAFALATSAGMVTSLRGYRGAPLVWIAGGTLATATAYLRVAADRHYATDVLVGALVGASAGVALPWLHRRRGGAAVPVVAVAPRGDGAAATIGWRW